MATLFAVTSLQMVAEMFRKAAVPGGTQAKVRAATASNHVQARQYVYAHCLAIECNARRTGERSGRIRPVELAHSTPVADHRRPQHLKTTTICVLG
jgi:hypothetical protein